MPECTADNLTPTLMRRIVHALDGNRTGQMVYVVVDREPPYKVPLVTSDLAAAQAAAEQSPSLCWSGPYRTVKTVSTKEDMVFLLRGHQPNSDWNGDEITAETFNPIPSTKLTDVEEIEVRWMSRGGNTESRKFRWDEADGAHRMVDALFFSVPALDKFLFPYIARVQGVRTAFEQRARLLERIETGQSTDAEAVLYDKVNSKVVRP